MTLPTIEVRERCGRHWPRIHVGIAGNSRQAGIDAAHHDRGRDRGALLLGYYTDDSSRPAASATGMSQKMLWELLRPHALRFAAGPVPCSLGRVHARGRDHLSNQDGDNLLRQTEYVGLREDKPADQVRA
jgi:hypothetical protein